MGKVGRSSSPCRHRQRFQHPSTVTTWLYPYESDFFGSLSCRSSAPFKSRRKTRVHESLGSTGARRAAEHSEGCHKRNSVGSAMQTPLEGKHDHHELVNIFWRRLASQCDKRDSECLGVFPDQPSPDFLAFSLELLKRIEHNGTATCSYSHAVDGEEKGLKTTIHDSCLVIVAVKRVHQHNAICTTFIAPAAHPLS